MFRSVFRSCVHVTDHGNSMPVTGASLKLNGAHTQVSNSKEHCIKTILDYHELTKHRLDRYAPGPGFLDWASQPDPFRTYRGARVVPLRRDFSDEDGISYDVGIVPGATHSAALNYESLSKFLYYALSLSAWKQAGSSKWSLRVNPSSGNLHPTEGYIIGGPMAGVSTSGFVGHYAPKQHALEIRTEFPVEVWSRLTGNLGTGGLLVGLTSIHWREAWKYGERAFRYCNHDVGHAIGALSYSAAILGWDLQLIQQISTPEMAALLGTFNDYPPGEFEHPDCILALNPSAPSPRDTTSMPPQTLDPEAIPEFADFKWEGGPNKLSGFHGQRWQAVEAAATATITPSRERGDTAAVAESSSCDRPSTTDASPAFPDTSTSTPPFPEGYSNDSSSSRLPLTLPQVIRRRRSAVAFDGTTIMSRDDFFRILYRMMFNPGSYPWNVAAAGTGALLADPKVSVLLFVHRVSGVPSGIYFLPRHPSHTDKLRAKRGSFTGYPWKPVDSCPVLLYRLVCGDAQDIAALVSCRQDIAGDSCFSLGMIAEFESPIACRGAWEYPRLFWECGVIGQVLYLEAEAMGYQGTGIGCFFDDEVHRLLNVKEGDMEFQSLYHFTVGGGVNDMRLSTLPAYGDKERKSNGWNVLDALKFELGFS